MLTTNLHYRGGDDMRLDVTGTWRGQSIKSITIDTIKKISQLCRQSIKIGKEMWCEYSIIIDFSIVDIDFIDKINC